MCKCVTYSVEHLTYSLQSVLYTSLDSGPRHQKLGTYIMYQCKVPGYLHALVQLWDSFLTGALLNRVTLLALSPSAQVAAGGWSADSPIISKSPPYWVYAKTRGSVTFPFPDKHNPCSPAKCDQARSTYFIQSSRSSFHLNHMTNAPVLYTWLRQKPPHHPSSLCHHPCRRLLLLFVASSRHPRTERMFSVSQLISSHCYINYKTIRYRTSASCIESAPNPQCPQCPPTKPGQREQTCEKYAEGLSSVLD